MCTRATAFEWRSPDNFVDLSMYLIGSLIVVAYILKVIIGSYFQLSLFHTLEIFSVSSLMKDTFLLDSYSSVYGMCSLFCGFHVPSE